MKLIVMDAGHGQNDCGAVGNGLQEKDLTLQISLKIAEYLSQVAEVKLTRTDDNVFSLNKSTDLSARAKFANNLKADFFVSVHINSGGGTGFESFVYTKADVVTKTLQGAIHKEISPEFTNQGLPDRGQKTDNLAVLRETNMPAMLIEYGFIDSVKDTNLLKDDSFIDSISLATANGIAKAFGLGEIVVEQEEEIVETVSAKVNGQTVEGFLKDGLTYVPLRRIGDILKANIGWDESSRTPTLDSIVVEPINVVLNGEIIDDGLLSNEGKSYVPTRVVSEKLGAKVDWDGDSRTVKIVK